MAAAVLMTAAASAFAQPERNDTLRTKTWSFYLQGGVGGFHGMRGPEGQYDRDKNYLAPVVDFGFMYYPRPWIRFGLDFGYTYLKTADPSVLTYKETIPDVTITKPIHFTGDLVTESARVQNRNFTNVASTDLSFGLNMLEIWREREKQWFNIWFGAGVGYMHGWNRYSVTWAIEESLVSQGPEHYNVYSHSSVESNNEDNQFNTLYVPFNLSMEFDVIPQLSLGAYGRYRYFPLILDNTPTGMWDAGVAIRYNMVGRKQGLKTKSDKIAALQNDLALYQAQLAASEKRYEELKDENAGLLSALDEMKEVQVEAVPEAAPLPIPKSAPPGRLLEVSYPLGNFAVQIYAFRQHDYSPDNSIFYNDHPTIYKNGDLKRYVVFTDTLEQAKVKLKELRTRYHDAFIVTIEHDGTVKPYRAE